MQFSTNRNGQVGNDIIAPKRSFATRDARVGASFNGDPLSLFLSFFFHSYSSIQVTTNDQSSRLLRYT